MKFGLRNCSELYVKLKHESSKLHESWNEYDAFNYFLTAWHLQEDWIRKDREGRPAMANRKVNKSPPAMKEIMHIARDITNGSKHFYLDSSGEKKKVVIDVHEPEIRDWHSYFISGPKYGVSTASAYYSISDLAACIDIYFEWLFNEMSSTIEFPAKLTAIIGRCSKNA